MLCLRSSPRSSQKTHRYDYQFTCLLALIVAVLIFFLFICLFVWLFFRDQVDHMGDKGLRFVCMAPSGAEVGEVLMHSFIMSDEVLISTVLLLEVPRCG